MDRLYDLNLIVKMRFGSHLYGTDTQDSDLDYKGVFMPDKKEVLLGRIKKCHNATTNTGNSRNQKHDVDTEVYSLHYFIKLACDGQTVALDMLHAPDDMIIHTSKLWQRIVSERQRFYTRNLKSFISYARRQASKYGIKGSRLNDVRRILDMLGGVQPEVKMKELWERLPRTEYCFDMEANPQGLRQYQVCGKVFQETASVGYVRPILQKYFDEYGHRAKLAAENRNIDWKAISHALRAAYQTKQIFTQGTIVFPLKDADFLRAVKQGRLDYVTEVAPVLESLMEEVEKLSGESSLPEKVDKAYWDAFLCDSVEQAVFGRG